MQQLFTGARLVPEPIRDRFARGRSPVYNASAATHIKVPISFSVTILAGTCTDSICDPYLPTVLLKQASFLIYR